MTAYLFAGAILSMMTELNFLVTFFDFFLVELGIERGFPSALAALTLPRLVPSAGPSAEI